MAKKHWSVVVGVSVAVGLVSSLFLKKHKTQTTQHIEALSNRYQGSWYFIDREHQVQHSFEIRPNLTIWIDGSELANELLELTTEKLVARDLYGYHIVVHCLEQEPKEYYDEANDQTYLLEKKEG